MWHLDTLKKLQSIEEGSDKDEIDEFMTAVYRKCGQDDDFEEVRSVLKNSNLSREQLNKISLMAKKIDGTI